MRKLHLLSVSFALVLSTACTLFRADVPSTVPTTITTTTTETKATVPAPVPAPIAPAAAEASSVPAPEPLRKYSPDELAARGDIVELVTDSGRAFGPAVRPENLKPDQYFVVSAFDNLYGTSLQMTADRKGTEVVPKGGKIGRLRALEDALVATRKAGASRPIPGVPDAEWDYKSLCVVVCGCQPMNLVSWQLKNPPPLQVVTYDEVRELLGRVGVLEDEMRGVKKDVREVKKDVAETKTRVAKIERRMSRGTKIALGVGTGIAIVALAALANSGGEDKDHGHPGPDPKPAPLEVATASIATSSSSPPGEASATLVTAPGDSDLYREPRTPNRMVSILEHLAVRIDLLAPKGHRSGVIAWKWSW